MEFGLLVALEEFQQLDTYLGSGLVLIFGVGISR